MQNRANGHFEEILTAREKSSLRGEVFQNRELVGVDLSAADLRGARFENSKLSECSLAGADLRGARFIRCELRAVDMTGALLLESRFDGTVLDEFVAMTSEDRVHVERAGGTFRHVHASLR